MYAAPQFTDCHFAGNTAGGAGGAINAFCSDPTFTRCTFTQNSAPTGGAVACVIEPGALLIDCLIWDNNASVNYGGGLYMSSSSPVLTNCTFTHNSAPAGSNIVALYNSAPSFENCIIALGVGSAGFDFIGTPEPTLTCCDMYGNEGGDWIGPLAEQLGTAGNLSEDPLFCNPAEDDFTLREDSPCAATQNPECGLIGALDVGCSGTSAVDERSAVRAPLTIAGIARSEVRFQIEVPAAMLMIYDLEGRPIRVLDAPAGGGTVCWDGCNTQGRRVPAGLYFARLNRGGGGTRTRFLLLP